MRLKAFTKRELLFMYGEHEADWIHPQSAMLRVRLGELYGPGLLYFQSLAFSEWLEGCPLRDPQAAGTVTVFKSDNGRWRAVAVFNPVASVRHADVLFELENVGIEYVPVPIRLIQTGYLTTPDFKDRSRRAIFAPLKVPFKRYHKERQ